MKVGVFVQCYNEINVLPWFIRYYRSMIPDVTICVMDNESTDGTGAYAASQGCIVHSFSTNNTLDDFGRLILKERARVLLPDVDWIISVDTDEFLIVSAQQLEEELRAGTSLLKVKGYTMVGESKAEDLHDLDFFAIDRGYPDAGYNKPCCYNPRLISRMNYSAGCHTARPVGDVVESSGTYDLYHYHMLGLPFLVMRYRVNHSRNIGNGCNAQHYTSDAEEVARKHANAVAHNNAYKPMAERISDLGMLCPPIGAKML